MQEAIENLFGAPLLRLVWPDAVDLNRQLQTVILEESTRILSVKQSNIGGWQSPKNLQGWNIPCVKHFLTMVDEAILKLTSACVGESEMEELRGKWTVVAWANINRYSNYNGLHNHGGGFWSGVYYVSAGKPENESSQEGSITFQNPTLAPLAMGNLRPPLAVRDIFRRNRTLKPLDGLMLLFPSWLEHYVHPYFGKPPRISISWDVNFRQ